ncbi:hypothetical protein [Pedobacter rhodius]|uniref:Uncharacterized protein n=1 Tax=Pedobacter rhodius TaxID=3004098 RepID=A0ABT4KTH2_9SPHI|nr:hypothetical protein [Pedobacter sp. SJ11]MCZ4222210.1 hypothetical protein [Pedobacter sp. SJ11]
MYGQPIFMVGGPPTMALICESVFIYLAAGMTLSFFLIKRNNTEHFYELLTGQYLWLVGHQPGRWATNHGVDMQGRIYLPRRRNDSFFFLDKKKQNRALLRAFNRPIFMVGGPPTREIL